MPGDEVSKSNRQKLTSGLALHALGVDDLEAGDGRVEEDVGFLATVDGDGLALALDLVEERRERFFPFCYLRQVRTSMVASKQLQM